MQTLMRVDGWDITPLFIAAQKSNVNLLQMLLHAGADPDIANKNKITPLIAAVQKENIDAVTSLVTARANVNAKTVLVARHSFGLLCGRIKQLLSSAE